EGEADVARAAGGHVLADREEAVDPAEPDLGGGDLEEGDLRAVLEGAARGLVGGLAVRGEAAPVDAEDGPGGELGQRAARIAGAARHAGVRRGSEAAGEDE